jgi:hypothetical protein
MGVFPKPVEPVSGTEVYGTVALGNIGALTIVSLFRTVAYVPQGQKFLKKARELCDEKKSSSGSLKEHSDEKKLSNSNSASSAEQ